MRKRNKNKNRKREMERVSECVMQTDEQRKEEKCIEWNFATLRIIGVEVSIQFEYFKSLYLK